MGRFRRLQKTRIDYLAIGSFLVRKAA